MDDEVRTQSYSEIKYEKRGRIAVITIDRPDALNAMNYWHYWALEEAVQRAAVEPDTHSTLIQAAGKFFSAGADVASGTAMLAKSESGETDWEARKALTGGFAGRNAVIATTFWNHPKVLMCALNGPVIGLSAALVALCDLIIARESAYLLVPFANLGLVSEGAAGYLLPLRLGLSVSNKALLLSQPIPAQELHRVGFLNEVFPASLSVEEFNAKAYQYLDHRLDRLDSDSLVLIKKLIHAPFDQAFNDMTSREIIGGLDRFSRGIPQMRFAEMATKSRRHKM